MPTLESLAGEDPEVTIVYVLRKVKIADLLDAFENTFKQLYDSKDYKGDWKTDAITAAVNDYVAKTDAVKQDYRDKKIVTITGSSMVVVGGILSFTPLAPIVWGLAGAGTAMNSVTNVVDLADRSKQNAWESAKNKLKDFVENPFQGTTFKVIQESLMASYAKIKNYVSPDDYSILLQGLGWNYFAFRKEGKSHEDAMKMLHDNLEFFRTNRFTISTDLRLGDENAIQDLQGKIAPSFNSLLGTAGALVMIGISAGVSISAITAGISIASATFRYAETIARGLLAIGNFASASLNIMFRFGPAISAIGGVVSIVFDSIALANLDKTFKPYYDFKDTCVRMLDESRTAYLKENDVIVEMLEFINADKKDLQSVEESHSGATTS